MIASLAEGLALGLLVGVTYGVSLQVGLGRALRLPPERALASVPVGSFLRLATAGLAFFLAGRLLPDANLAAGAAAAIGIVGLSLYRMAREGVRL